MEGGLGGGQRERGEEREREREKERELGTGGLLKEDIGVDTRLDVVSHVAGAVDDPHACAGDVNEVHDAH